MQAVGVGSAKSKRVIPSILKRVLFSCHEGGDVMAKKSKPKNPHKYCFSKKLLIADYVILLLMIIVFFVFTMTGKDTSNCAIVLGAWIAQIAVSSGCYYWKAKSENLITLPIQLLEDLDDEMRAKADPNQIIASVLGIGTHQ